MEKRATKVRDIDLCVLLIIMASQVETITWLRTLGILHFHDVIQKVLRFIRYWV